MAPGKWGDSLRKRPSPAMAVAMLALFVSLTGVGVAAVKLGANTVKAKQIAPGAVGTSEAADNALSGADIDEASLKGVAPAGAAGGSLTGSYPSPSLVPNEGWHEIEPASTPGGEPDFENGWTNLGGAPNVNQGVFSTLAFRRDRDGLVHLKGVVTGGTISGAQQIFNLPGGYRPSQAGIFLVPTGGAPSTGTVYIGATGSPFAGSVLPFSGSNVWESLDGITFRCGPSGANGCP